MQNVIARNGVAARRSRSKPEKIPHFVRNRLRNDNKPVNCFHETLYWDKKVLWDYPLTISEQTFGLF
ncbi:MAG: hypothetical protein KGJ87_01090 [Planctomycetota bacterium]|nr:hypothetical protein [Planctomycetota bacterium]MDE2215751.1 hypothetical protein [Planctomycetota bacterium]